MESKSQQKLRERREKAALQRIEHSLGNLLTGDSLQSDALPEWVGEAITRSWDIFTEPSEKLRDDAAPEELDAWIEGLLSEHAVTGRVYVASHLGIVPWLECRIPPQGWMATVREAIEEPWQFLSLSLDTMIIVTEAEYYFEAHVMGGAPGLDPE
ncbi:hypothetical protein GCM10018793_37370 [Streptomyces sulfonofaciens]|uniref:Uncharacterized protein n=1 Tax=Streptomyces sulfonofaciens TaxID=68272 RepID=A0A919L1Z5_9ACTN|nr:hypothetical protein [Streptomyces sulfonofaciens]GHH80968.1 hypothetical protein GCM10018793_37370 [Streptomyces sulfonofaciens]